MSLAKLNAKETKGKQKGLPKLKTILANPITTRCPVLNEQEMDQLKVLVQKSIDESRLEPRQFATQTGISLGLESSLRNINNNKTSCVLISLSIRPNHIVTLIGRCAELKDETQPVFAQPKLEDFIQQVFGIKALCMVFPKDLSKVGELIEKWIESRKKKPKKVKTCVQSADKTSRKKVAKLGKRKPKNKPQEDLVKQSPSEDAAECWTGDFISFSEDSTAEMSKTVLHGSEAVGALSQIIDKIPITTSSLKAENLAESEPMEVDCVKGNEIINEAHSMIDDSASENSDDFLGEYKSLTVHKIKNNPNKKPKQKRKKNKKKIVKK